MLFFSSGHTAATNQALENITSMTQSQQEFLGKIGIGKRYALVIGISEYDHFNSLPTTRDPLRFREYLINDAKYDHVRYLTDRQATRSNIRSVIKQLSKIVTKNDQFLIYWSGHATTTVMSDRKKGFFALSDSEENDFSSMISFESLKVMASAVQSKQKLYILDACFTGLAGYATKGSSRQQLLSQIAKPSEQILTAGTEFEETIAISSLGGSLFTAVLIDGLKGKADTSFSKQAADGIITLTELMPYLRERIALEIRKVRWRQPITPQLFTNSGLGEYFFLTKKILNSVEINNNDPKPDVPAFNGDVFKNNQEKEYVANILAKLGYDTDLTAKSPEMQIRVAISQFQSEWSLDRTAIIDRKTHDMLVTKWADFKNKNKEYKRSRGHKLVIQGNVLNGSAQFSVGRKIAIVIGISDYKYLSPNLGKNNPKLNLLLDLEYAEKDATDFANMLGNATKFNDGWTIHKLIGKDATERNVQTTFDKVFGSALRQNDFVYVFFAGHGRTNPLNSRDIRLLMYDSDPKFSAAGIEYESFRRNFTASDAGYAIAFIDACKSGSIKIGRGENSSPDQSLLGKLYQAPPTKIIFTSGSGNQLSFEDKELKNGVFTHYLIKGLNGAAPKIDNDYYVDLNELERYVSDNVTSFTENHPEMNLQQPRVWQDKSLFAEHLPLSVRAE